MTKHEIVEGLIDQ